MPIDFYRHLRHSFLAELDKKRAIAIASKESWLARSSKKSSELMERVDEIINDITNAEKAGEMQKLHIHKLHQMYKDNWDIRQEVILRSHNAKVSELQDACQSKGQVDSHSTASVTALQAQVTQLLAQLATLGVQPIVVEQTAPLDSGTGTRNPALDLGTPVGEPGAPGIEEAQNTLPPVSDLHKGKGKGKGKDDCHGMY